MVNHVAILPRRRLSSPLIRRRPSVPRLSSALPTEGHPPPATVYVEKNRRTADQWLVKPMRRLITVATAAGCIKRVATWVTVLLRWMQPRSRVASPTDDFRITVRQTLSVYSLRTACVNTAGRVGGTPTSACTGLLGGGDWRPQAGIACRRPTGTAHRQDDNPRVSRVGLRSDQTGRLNSPCKFRGPYSQQHFSASGFLLHRHRYCVIKR